jgi:hypothetical protein
MLNPPIDLFGLRILEPVTSLTDLISSGVCLFAFLRLHLLGRREAMHQFFKYYFLFMSLAVGWGGFIGHAFLYQVTDYWQEGQWNAETYGWKSVGWCFSGLGMLLIELGSVLHVRERLGRWQLRFLYVFFGIQLLAFYALILNPATRSFLVPNFNSSIAMVGVVLPLHVYAFWQKQSQGSRLFLLAFGLGLVTSLVYNSQFSFSRWFNYHDISHLIVAITQYTFYRGARYMATTEYPPSQTQLPLQDL